MAGQVWGTNNLGGFMSAKNLSMVLRHVVQPMVKFRQFCDPKDASMTAKNRGALFTWNSYSNVATGGAALTETSAMPETNFTVTPMTVTITEYGNSVPYAGKLDNLSEHPVKELIEKVLKHDCVKTLDAAAAAQFEATPLVTGPASGNSTTALAALATNGVAPVTNNVAFNLTHLKLVIDTMKERNIPAYIGDDYVAIGRPATFRNLKSDLENVFKYSDAGFGSLLSGEIGRYENMRIVEQTNVASKAWSNGLSDQIIFIGEDTVVEAVAVPEEVRGKIPTDYGRSMGVAWYYLGAFGLARTAAADARIVKWGSVA